MKPFTKLLLFRSLKLGASMLGLLAAVACRSTISDFGTKLCGTECMATT